MIQRMWSKAMALGLCGVLGMVLAPGCDTLGLGTCDTSTTGGPDGAEEEDGNGGASGDGEVPTTGCTRSRTCLDL